MSERPFLAARVEEAFNIKAGAAMRLMGWKESVVAYAGYGSAQTLRVMGRVVMTPPDAMIPLAEDFERFLDRRGWRNFWAIPAVNTPVRVKAGDQVHVVWTDRDGYLDQRIPNPGLSVGWREVTIWTRLSQPTVAPIQVVSDTQTFGLISDIDDTVITTWLPRPMIAAYNTFWLTERARECVDGMAAMYQRCLEHHPLAPVFYMSTGSYDTYPFLRRFLQRHEFPEGTLLLTDWGPTNTGWFRSGMEHKRHTLRELAQDFPNIKWLLVGDDGQHDPDIYGDFAQQHRDHVRAIAIRQLSEAQHTLAHGTPTHRIPMHHGSAPKQIVEAHAYSGHGLWPKIKPAITYDSECLI